jgi:glycosyltransferase involved in cell wall biosynthesis
MPVVTGMLVPPGYPEAISEAVLGLLRDPDRCRRMSAAARRWVVENYEDRRVLGMAVAFYLSLIRRTGAAEIEMGKSGLKRLLV